MTKNFYREDLQVTLTENANICTCKEGLHVLCDGMSFEHNQTAGTVSIYTQVTEALGTVSIVPTAYFAAGGQVDKFIESADALEVKIGNALMEARDVMSDNEDYTILKGYYDSMPGFAQVEDCGDYYVYVYITEELGIFGYYPVLTISVVSDKYLETRITLDVEDYRKIQKALLSK